MGKPRKRWFLLAYDIRDPRRLQRTHAFVRKRGIALQRSVFLIRADRESLAELEAGIRQRVHDRRDDVRLYPVPGPAALWAAGLQQAAIGGLFAAGPDRQPEKPQGPIRRLFARRKR